MPRRVLLSAFLLATALGCGGGSSSSAAKPRLTIDWPARSRGIEAPATAESVRLLLNDPASSAAPQMLTLPRPDTASATTRTYAFPKSVPAGSYNLLVEFFAEGEPTGVRVGTANLPIKVDDKGSLLLPDGAPLGDLTLTGTVQWVHLAPDQELIVGNKVPLGLQAITSDNKIFAPRPDSVSFIISGGSGLVVNPDGTVTGRTEGTYTVVATVDGVASGPQVVSVVGAPITPRILALDASDIVSNRVQGRVYASIKQENGGRIVEIDPATGNLLKGQDLSAQPRMLAISDDASRLYAPLGGSVVPFDLPSLTPRSSIPLSDDPWASPWIVSDLSVQPGHPDTFAVSGGGYFMGPTELRVYDSGTMRPSTAGNVEGAYSAWASPDRLLVESRFSPFEVYSIAVGPDGAAVQNSVSDAFSGFSEGFTYADGRLYGNDLTIRDATSLASVGRFGPAQSSPPVFRSSYRIYGPAIDSAAKRAFFIEADEEGGRLLVYRTDDFSPVAARRIAGFPVPRQWDPARRYRLVRWGAKGLAVPTTAGIFLIDNAPGL